MTSGVDRTRQEIEEIVNDLGYNLSDEYFDKNGKRRVVIKDSNGYRWDGNLTSLMNPNWGISFFDKRNHYTLENIILWLSINRPEFELSDGNIYINSKEKLVFFHNVPECQEKFCVGWSTIYLGAGCSVCAGQQVGKRTSLAYLRPDLAAEWHPANEKDPSEVVCGSGERAYWICSNPECDYGRNGEWNAKIYSRSNGRGCPACAGRVVTDKNRLSIRFPDISEEWDYEKNLDTPDDIHYSSNKKRWWVCSEGHSYFSSINSRTNKGGRGCKKCSSSRGEGRILNWVENNVSNLRKVGVIGCIPEKKFRDCKDKIVLRFDFGFEYSDTTWSVTEFQGEQHFYPVDFSGKGDEWAKKEFEDQIKKDKIKENYCMKNNIPLLIIPYWEFDNIEIILEKFFFG